MSENETALIGFWKGLDTLLLTAVFILLAAWLYVSHPSSGVWLEPSAEPLANEMARPPRHLPSEGRVVSGMRVGLGHDRLERAVRSMAEDAWEEAPASPAVDMREDGQSFDIFFAIPRGMDASNVRVSAQQGVLTLAMVSDGSGSVLLQRFRVPCGVAPNGAIETAVSNNVLRVRIRPPQQP